MHWGECDQKLITNNSKTIPLMVVKFFGRRIQKIFFKGRKSRAF